MHELGSGVGDQLMQYQGSHDESGRIKTLFKSFFVPKESIEVNQHLAEGNEQIVEEVRTSEYRNLHKEGYDFLDVFSTLVEEKEVFGQNDLVNGSLDSSDL